MTPQEKNTYCVCAVLQDIFSDYGIKKSQDEIAINLEPAKNGFYVDDSKIKNFLLENHFSYDYFPYDQTPFNEPDNLLKEMKNNSGFFGIGIHTYKVLEFKDPEIRFVDPLNCSEGKKNIYELMSEMKNKFGFFSLIKKLK